MATDSDLNMLHFFAKEIGLKRAWFQEHPFVPHYDLTPGKRAMAIRAGAIPVSATELARRCRR